MAFSAAWMVEAASAAGPPKGWIALTVLPVPAIGVIGVARLGSIPNGLPAWLKKLVSAAPRVLGSSVNRTGSIASPVTTLEVIASA